MSGVFAMVDLKLWQATSLLVRWWCSLTGRDNFVLAFGLLWASLVLVVLIPAIWFVTGTWWAMFGWGLVPSCCHKLRVCRRLARGVREGAGVLNITQNEADALRSDGVVYMVVGAAFLVPQLLTMSLGCYAMRHLNGGDKSILARARDRVTAWVGSRGLVPVPVGA